MTESLVQWFNENLSGVLPAELIVLAVSMIPIIELRGGIILASLYGFPLWKAFSICIIGNIIPVPFILWLITPIFAWMKKWKIFRPLVEWLEKHSLGEKSDKIRKYEFWGLLLFVGIPLPGTGAWTGSLIAALLELKKKKSLFAVFCGLLLASAIMMLISYGIPAVVRLF